MNTGRQESATAKRLQSVCNQARTYPRRSCCAMADARAQTGGETQFCIFARISKWAGGPAKILDQVRDCTVAAGCSCSTAAAAYYMVAAPPLPAAAPAHVTGRLQPAKEADTKSCQAAKVHVPLFFFSFFSHFFSFFFFSF